VSKPRTLTIALADRPHVRPLLAGEIGLAGYAYEAVAVEPIIGAYRQMVRELSFDVCELAPTTYLMALSAGIELTAIPVFLDRRFHHGDLRCAVGSGITEPAGLAGRRVGVRAYSVTTGVWVRGILSEEYGVDLSAVTWVVDDDDHLAIALPPNVERAPADRSLRTLLDRGQIDAALTGNAGTGRAGAPRAGWTDSGERPDAGGRSYPLFPDPDPLDRSWYERTGIYPVHAVVALRADLVRRDPGIATALYDAFCESKRRQEHTGARATADDRLRSQADTVDGDPLPYGLERNRKSIETLARFTRDQGLIAEPPPAVFAPGDYETG
jgi:4,5-dihydroxyphthalate decarboxylase